MRFVAMGVSVCNASVRFTTFIKGAIRFDRIAPFIGIWHGFDERCKRGLWDAWWSILCQPYGMGFAAVFACGWPTMTELEGEKECEGAEPIVIGLGLTRPDCARMMNVNRAISCLLRIRKLFGCCAQMWRGWQSLLCFANRHDTFVLE